MRKTILTVALLAISSSAFAAQEGRKSTTTISATEEQQEEALKTSVASVDRERRTPEHREAEPATSARNQPKATRTSSEAESLELDPTPVARTKNAAR